MARALQVISELPLRHRDCARSDVAFAPVAGELFAEAPRATDPKPLHAIAERREAMR